MSSVKRARKRKGSLALRQANAFVSVMVTPVTVASSAGVPAGMIQGRFSFWGVQNRSVASGMSAGGLAASCSN
jgi:hypothetical protein